MPEKLARSVVVTPCCRHHSLTERPLLRHSWICAAHSCSSARCFNSALVILTPHNTTVAKRFATFRYYCLMCVQPPSALTVTIPRWQLRPDAGLREATPCGGHPVGLQEIYEYEALGGGSGRHLYCRLTSLSRSLQINLRINLDGTKTAWIRINICFGSCETRRS